MFCELFVAVRQVTVALRMSDLLEIRSAITDKLLNVFFSNFFTPDVLARVRQSTEMQW